MRTKTVYKVVYNSRVIRYNRTCNLMSCSLNNYLLYYEIGQTAIPKIGKIFVFDTIEKATDFWYNNQYMVLEGTGTNPYKPKFVCSSSSSCDIKRFWEMKKNKKSVEGSYPMNPIKGTLLVDSFTPIKIVRNMI